MKTIQYPTVTTTTRQPHHPPQPELADEASKENYTVETALREAGVNEVLLAKTLKEQLEAKRPRWNRKKNAFEFFPDYRTRFAAIREILKIFGGDPSEDDKYKEDVTILLNSFPRRGLRPPAGDVGERSERCSSNADEHKTAPNAPNSTA